MWVSQPCSTGLCILPDHSLWSMFWDRFVCVSWRCSPETCRCSPNTSWHGGARAVIRELILIINNPNKGRVTHGQFRMLPSSPHYPTSGLRWKTGGRSPKSSPVVAHFHEQGGLHGHMMLCRRCSPRRTPEPPHDPEVGAVPLG